MGQILEILRSWNQQASEPIQMRSRGRGRNRRLLGPVSREQKFKKGAGIGGKIMSLNILSLRSLCDKLVEGFSKWPEM